MTDSSPPPSQRDGASKARPPRRAEVLAALADARAPRHTSEIAMKLEVAPRFLDALGRVLDDLVFDGSVVALPGQRFRLATDAAEVGPANDAPKSRGKRADRDHGDPRSRASRATPTFGSRHVSSPVFGAKMVEGHLSVNQRGFGFVSGGAEPDVFIPEEAIGGALHGDKVRARVVAKNDRGLEGTIDAIIERRSPRFTGLLEQRGKSAWIVPDDSRLRGPIVLTHPTDVESGIAVVGVIARFPETRDENPEGTIVEVLGKPGTIEVESRKILAMHGVDEGFTEAAEAQARSYGGEVSPAQLEGREDLTHLPLPTIDPIDARDHDDAVWAIRNDDGSYRAWIAIADVSAYVTEGSPIDDAALNRGCSIYLPTRAIPMLPRALSSDLCSLLPDKIRLCLAVEVDIDATGVPTKSRVIEGFMRSAAKLNYEGVANALGLSTEAPAQDQAIAMRGDLAVLHDVSKLLHAQRLRRGALTFHAPEAKVVVDKASGLPSAIEKRGQDPGVSKAYEIIEELMLLANETVAQIMVERDVPTIFRDHGSPDLAKLAKFGAMCARLGVAFDEEEAAEPKRLAAFIKRLRTNPRAQILDALLIRSMKQANYDTKNIGHYGLASDAYLHFTSPIRRYPDVVVHRTLRKIARKERIDRSESARAAMHDAAVRASLAERRAMEIERETVDLYRCFYMRDHLGEAFTATVGGFSSSSAYAVVDTPYIDVMLKADALGPGAYELDDDGLSMVSRSGDRVSFGDAMLVQIDDVNITRRQIIGRRIGTIEREDDGDGAMETAAPRRASKRRRHTSEAPPPSASARGPKSRSASGAKSSKPGKSGRKSKTQPIEKTTGKSAAKGRAASSSKAGKSKKASTARKAKKAGSKKRRDRD